MSTTRSATPRRCPVCEGEGKIVNPAVSVWTEGDRDEDPDGFQSMLDGAYDIVCPCCAGSGEASTAQLAAYRERQADLFTQRMESGDYADRI